MQRNAELFRRIADKIEREPACYDQAEWCGTGIEHDFYPIKRVEACSPQEAAEKYAVQMRRDQCIACDFIEVRWKDVSYWERFAIDWVTVPKATSIEKSEVKSVVLVFDSKEGHEAMYLDGEFCIASEKGCVGASQVAGFTNELPTTIVWKIAKGLSHKSGDRWPQKLSDVHFGD